jgi:hypothetical protein
VPNRQMVKRKNKDNDAFEKIMEVNRNSDERQSTWFFETGTSLMKDGKLTIRNTIMEL